MNERTAPVLKLLLPVTAARNSDKATFHNWETGRITTEAALLRFRIANDIPMEVPIDRDAFVEMMEGMGYHRCR